ncbi:MAG TPA: cytochrome c oxidase subunit 3 [Gaiellaceae bacterium]|nr:cytochrome c oxidase subunit 3 [Gaiellaceae bacterium]
MAIFVATEATLFGTIFGTYYYLRFKAPHWPPAGIAPPDLTVPLVLAFVLAATSVPMVIAVRAGRAGNLVTARQAVVAALVVQAGFFAMQLNLFENDLAKLSPQRSAYGSIYFTMLGAHETHVALGLLLDVWLLAKLARGLTRYRLVALQSIALYWHFVNVLALLVVGAQLSARL